jgi:hypothetical protein
MLKFQEAHYLINKFLFDLFQSLAFGFRDAGMRGYHNR